MKPTQSEELRARLLASTVSNNDPTVPFSDAFFKRAFFWGTFLAVVVTLSFLGGFLLAWYLS